MPPCLRDLFKQTGWEQEKRFANNAHSSAESFTSALEIRGMQLPPPLVGSILLKLKLQNVDFW